MSLDGNLRVFSLTEVLQMLGMQHKSGVLTVEGPKDTISVGFVTGRIVSVESSSNRIENRLGTLLVKAGRLSEDELSGALELQKKKQGRLGRLLLTEEIVRAEDLREAIRIQVQRILFAAFGWTDGRFRFAPQAVIEHDPEIFQPLPTESILLEAARHFDELPLAEQKVPSNELVFRRAPSAHTRQLVAGSSSDQEGALAVSKREAETWKWIDGRRTVAEIRERAFLSDLDVLKGISDLLDRGLLEEGYLRETPSSAEPARRRTLPITTILPWIPLIAAAAAAASFAPRNPANLLLQPVSQNRPARDLLKANSLARLLTVGRAVRVYYGATGRYPRTLGQIVAQGILGEDSLQDPYGRFYRYILRPEDGKFALYGRSANGQIDLDLAHEGQLAPAAEVRPAGTPLTPPPERPAGVRVVN
ncbi:MAG TPA: DUF4388 domain-containing protein [Thermoanaerobaculia bacterium]|nr:DUF4388 domain-containing protein [Thermoanaerobaculia bacterium]